MYDKERQKFQLPCKSVLPLLPVKLDCSARSGLGMTTVILRTTASLIGRPPKLLKCVI